MVGGIVAELGGGKFGNGFVSAGVTAYYMPQLGSIGNDVARSTAGALVGGTASAMTGGKFANGAISGAMQAAMARPSRGPREGSGRGSGDPERGRLAAAEANQAMAKAGGFGVHATYRDAEQAFADIVGPLQDEYGVELGSHIYRGQRGYAVGRV